MKKIYYLSTCDTCKRIIAELKLKDKGFTFQDIKTEKITAKQLEEMTRLMARQEKMSDSYESLFSRIARKYKELKLADKQIAETDYKNFILEEYTFLKRPVILVNGAIFVGNSKATIIEAKKVI